ncbi:MAG: energy-coupling factor transporter transmembrane protein EcfT [Muribaculaceae bacterium]|nr:energy-coupling factor transporter transmembrane protein EcfT [Muribaculaceae bacterium]
MASIEKAITRLNSLEAGRGGGNPAGDVRVQLWVTVAFLLALLSIPVYDPARLLWMACYPIISSEICGIGYLRVLLRSLWILPLVVVIGVFNPLLDNAVVWKIGPVEISRGWLSFISLVIRGLLAFQALVVLVESCGFQDICRALRYFKCPGVLVTQLMMLYRYLGVLMQEALLMKRAREARGYGRKSYPLRLWATFAGQLLLHSVKSAMRVHVAMTARGFDAVFRFRRFSHAPSARDWVYLIVWIGVFAALRFLDLTAFVGRLIM